MVSFSHFKKWRTVSDPQADNTRFLFGAILYQVDVVFNGNHSFLNSMNFASAGSSAEAYPAAVVAAILAGKTVLTRMLFGVPSRFLRDVYFTLQSGNGYKRHAKSPMVKV
jgi:hypothetical protein